MQPASIGIVSFKNMPAELAEQQHSFVHSNINTTGGVGNTTLMLDLELTVLLFQI